MRTAGNISIQCKAAATDADPDAYNCTQTSASESANYSASLKVTAGCTGEPFASVVFAATHGTADGVLACIADYPGAPGGQLACFTASHGPGGADTADPPRGPAYATRLSGTGLKYTTSDGNDVTLTWSS